jgi:hypothetical protein
LSALLTLVSFLAFPFFAFPAYFLSGAGAQRDVFQSADAIVSVVTFGAVIILFIVGFLANAVSMSAATLGVWRAERGEGGFSFASLLRDSLRYFGRILAVLLIINLSIGLVFTLFFLVVFVLTLVTIGMASIFLQPLVLLVAPLSLLVLGVLESAQAAVIVDDMNALDAVKRGLNLVWENIWKYVLITLIIYFGTSFIMSILMTPLMAPFFVIPFFASSGKFDAQTMILIMTGFMCLFFPLMTLFQSIIMTFMKSALFLTYLRLANPAKDIPVFVEASAQQGDLK